MLRFSFTILAIAILVGCTGTQTSPTASVEAPVVIEPSTQIAPAMTEASVESPVAETTTSPEQPPAIQEYPVPPGTHPHDVAPALDGTVWYTAQHAGALGKLDPEQVRRVISRLGQAPRHTA